MKRLFNMVILQLALLNLCSSLMGQKTLSFVDFVNKVHSDHPISVSAQLYESISDAYNLKAKGSFDPKLSISYDAKAFDNKNYFRQLQTKVEIPTIIGPDLSLGYDRNSGLFLDDSNTLPESGLINLGISVPLGQGLFFDDRRKMLAEAKVIAKANENAKKIMINNLLKDASMIYLDWQVAEMMVQVYAEGVALAEELLNGTRSGFIAGDKAAIDTLESSIVLQDRKIALAKSKQLLIGIKNILNNYLWDSGRIPLGLKDDIKPEPLDILDWSAQLDWMSTHRDSLILQNPELTDYVLKSEQLDLDLRLQKELLKPSLDVKFNPLVNVNAADQIINYNVADYKWGFDFSYPILNRKNRAEIKLTELYMDQNEYKTIQKQEILGNKFQSIIQQDSLILMQKDWLADNVNQNQILTEAERVKFQLGESSIFLVNSRESKYLQSQIKYSQALRKLKANRIKLITGFYEYRLLLN